MTHSLLITGGNPQIRLEKAKQISQQILGRSLANNPDFLFFDEKSIKISQIRELKKKLALKPYYTHSRVALISDADHLTIPAQNALLKTLEEPPGSTIIILSVANQTLLLPTIVSRCQVIFLSNPKEVLVETDPAKTDLINSLLSSSPGQRLLISEKYSQNRDQVSDFCQTQLLAFRKILLTGKISQLTPLQIVKILHQIQHSLHLLKANVNHRLVLENLLLSYPSSII